MSFGGESAYRALSTHWYRVFFLTIGSVIQKTMDAFASPEALELRASGKVPSEISLTVSLLDEIGEEEYSLLKNSPEMLESHRGRSLLRTAGRYGAGAIDAGITPDDIINGMMQEAYGDFVRVVSTGVCALDVIVDTYRKYTWVDSFGLTSIDKAVAQFKKFIKHTIPDMPKDELSDAAIVLCFLAEMLKDNYISSEDIGNEDDFLPGIEFENRCRSILEESGFSVRTTPLTGDYGADLLAEKDDLLYSIQAKSGRSPAGTKAVQESIAARSYYGADYCVVVSESGFTPGAIEIAAKSGVLLVGENGLKVIDTMSRDL